MSTEIVSNRKIDTGSPHVRLNEEKIVLATPKCNSPSNHYYFVRIALIVFFAIVSMGLGAVSPTGAANVVKAVRTCLKLGNISPKVKVIDATIALKNGKKVFRAVDLAEDSVRLGKGMLGKMSDSVADNIIEECAILVKTKKAGASHIGPIIDKEVSKVLNLTQRERDILLNDAYLRILQKAGRISPEVADDAFRLLKSTKNLHKLVRHCCSINNTVTGPRYELMQALAFRKKGFDVLGVDLGFAYRINSKEVTTDLDLLVKKGKNLFLIESKHYTNPNIWKNGMTPEILKKSDGLLDLKSLLDSEFGGAFNVQPIFTFRYEPPISIAKQLFEKGTPPVDGTAEELAERLAALF